MAAFPEKKSEGNEARVCTFYVSLCLSLSFLSSLITDDDNVNNTNANSGHESGLGGTGGAQLRM